MTSFVAAPRQRGFRHQFLRRLRQHLRPPRHGAEDERRVVWTFKDALVKFTNGAELQHYIRAAWDIFTPGQLKTYIKEGEKKGFPELRGGKIQAVTIPLTPGVEKFSKFLKQVYAKYLDLKPKDRRELSYLAAVSYGASLRRSPGHPPDLPRRQGGSGQQDRRGLQAHARRVPPLHAQPGRAVDLLRPALPLQHQHLAGLHGGRDGEPRYAHRRGRGGRFRRGPGAALPEHQAETDRGRGARA